MALSNIYLNYTVLMYGTAVVWQEEPVVEHHCRMRGSNRAHCRSVVVIGYDDF